MSDSERSGPQVRRVPRERAGSCNFCMRTHSVVIEVQRANQGGLLARLCPSCAQAVGRRA